MPATISVRWAIPTLAIISDLSALTFDMNIDELDISKVKVGQRVRITVDALPGQEFSGYIDKININGTTTGGATSYPGYRDGRES